MTKRGTTQMKTIKLKTKEINAAAQEAGMSAENFVAMIRSISRGRRVCAHFKGIEGAYSVFECE